MASDVETLVRRFFDDAINARNLDAFDQFCSPDYVFHGGADPGALGDVHGLAGFKDAVAEFFTAFPDLRVEILDVVSSGDKAAVRFRETGTHLGSFIGFDPTGRSVIFAGMGLYRAERGKLVEEWSHDDSRALLEQIGAIPVIRAPES